MRLRSVLGMIPAILIAAGLLMGSGVGTSAATASKNGLAEGSNMSIYYLEIVTNDVEALCATYERVHDLSFGPEDPNLGQARVAARPDGSFVGIRKPLAEHERPIVRTYVATADIQKAVKEAEEAGALLAYPPTQHGKHGTFAIFIHGDVEHGLWQR